MRFYYLYSIGKKARRPALQPLIRQVWFSIIILNIYYLNEFFLYFYQCAITHFKKRVILKFHLLIRNGFL